MEEEDVMTRSNYGKVIFNSVDWTSEHLICQFYPSYIYGEVRHASVRCSVGLYLVPRNNPKDYIVKQEIVILDQTMGEDIRLKFERSKLPLADARSYYIFQFMNEGGEIMGASTPFRIQSPSSSVMDSSSTSEESDEFVVISQSIILKEEKENNDDLKKQTKLQSLDVSNPTSFLVLAEESNSPEIYTDDKEEKEIKQVDQREILDDIPNVTELKEELEEAKRDCSKLKSELLVVNEIIEDRDRYISQLEDINRSKEQRITDLEKILKEKKMESKDFNSQNFQMLTKSSQMKIYQLEQDIKSMEMEMKRISSSNDSEFDDIKKSINDLQTSVKSSERSMSPLESSFDNMSSLVIEKALDPSKSSVDEPQQESMASSSTTSSKATPRILDNGKVVYGHACPVCAMEFDESEVTLLMDHVNNHYPLEERICPLCFKIFEQDQESELEIHVQSHFDEPDEQFETESSPEGDAQEASQPSEPSTERPQPFNSVRNILGFLNTLKNNI